MREDDPVLIAWSQELREAREEIDRSDVFGRLDPQTNEPIPNWVGLRCTSTNNETGSSVAEMEVRPVLRGRLEMVVRVESRGVNASKSHTKTVYLAPTSKTLREFAHRLLQTADEADKRAKSNGPRLVR